MCDCCFGVVYSTGACSNVFTPLAAVGEFFLYHARLGLGLELTSHRHGRVPDFSLGATTEAPKAESGGGVLGDGAATFSPPAMGSGAKGKRQWLGT